MAIRMGVNMWQFCSVSNSLSHTTLSNKVRDIFFLRTVLLVYYCVVVMILHTYVDVYVLCVCIIGHGGDYTTACLNQLDSKKLLIYFGTWLFLFLWQIFLLVSFWSAFSRIFYSMCLLLISLKIWEYKFYINEIFILFFWNIPIHVFWVDLYKTKEMCIL